MNTLMSRRSALRKVSGGAAVLGVAASLSDRLAAANAAVGANVKGRVNHSVCKWCYPKISVEELCQAGKEFGLRSVELLTVDQFPTLKKHDMACAMVSGVPGGIENGLNRLENHDTIAAYMDRTVPIVPQ